MAALMDDVDVVLSQLADHEIEGPDELDSGANQGSYFDSDDDAPLSELIKADVVQPFAEVTNFRAEAVAQPPFSPQSP